MIYYVLIFLVIASMYFSSLETGLMALGEIKIKKLARGQISSLKLWLEDPAAVITGILIGNNAVNIVFTALFTLLVIKFTELMNLTTFPAEIIAITGSSGIILIFGEIIPKTFANTYPEKIVMLSYKSFSRFLKLIKFPIFLLNTVSSFLAGKFGKKKEKSISRKELDIYLSDIQQAGILRREDSRMMGRVLFLTKTLVKDVMTPREKIYAVNLNLDYSGIMEKLLKSSYSRIPAYENSIDNYKGFIYIKDVIGVLNRKHRADFSNIVRDPYITAGDENCHSLFKKMRKARTHIALVKIEGRIKGLVTIEDLIEEIVGEIYDEYDINTGS